MSKKPKPKPKRRTPWTDEEKENIRDMMEEIEGDVVSISKEINSGKRAVRTTQYLWGMMREN